MGNRLSLSFVFLSFFISILFTSFSSAKIVKNKSFCPSQINNNMSSIKYLDTPLSGNISACIKDDAGYLISDDQAKSNCGSQFLNYYSPDYVVNGSNTSSRGAAVYDNTQGTLYVCFTGGTRKELICNAKAKEHNQGGKILMEWRAEGGHGNGRCYCAKSKNAALEPCDGGTDPTVDSPVASCGNIANSKLVNDNDSDNKPVCRCNQADSVGQYLDIDPANPGNQKCPSSSTAATGNVTPAFKQCIDEEVVASVQCKEIANTAKDKCNVESKDADNTNEAKKIATKNVSDTNKFLQMGAGAVGVLGKAMVQKSAGTGAISDCLMTGAAANAAKSSLLGLQEECTDNYNKCTTLCSGDKAKEIWDKCAKNIEYSNLDTTAPADRQLIDQNYYNDKLAEVINPNYETGKQTCTDKVTSDDTKASDKSAKANKNYFDTFMKDMASTMQSSAVCACQVSAGSTGATGAAGCSAVPTQEQCIANNYMLAGCASYGIMDVCTVGSTSYSASACACKMGTSSDASCKTVATAGAASGFSGSPLGNSSGSGTAGFGPPGSSGVGGSFPTDMNLSGPKAEDLAGGPKNTKELSGFPSGPGGSGSGGVSAPPGSGAGGGGENAAVESDGKSGSGGLFGQAKSFIGSMFGGSKNNNGNGTGVIPGRGTPGIDLERFRPAGLRGLAGSSGIGGKNMDIWKMMNSRYEANSITFIQTP